MSTKNRTVIIASSPSGIGLAVARAFLQEGANVVINDRDSGKFATVTAELGTPDRIASAAGDSLRRQKRSARR